MYDTQTLRLEEREEKGKKIRRVLTNFHTFGKEGVKVRKKSNYSSMIELGQGK